MGRMSGFKKVSNLLGNIGLRSLMLPFQSFIEK